MSSYTRINIRINPDNPGVVVNNNELSQNQKQKKNSLYGEQRDQIPEKDKPMNGKQKNLKQKKNNQTVSTKPNKSAYKPSREEIANAQKERDQIIKQFKNTKASNEMIYTSAHLLKQQNELIHQNQKIMHQLINENKKGHSQGPKQSKGTAQRQQLKKATQSVNNEVEQIRKMRDQIVKVGKQIQQNIRNGNLNLPQNINQMNQMNKNLRNKVNTSLKNIDLLSPEKFDLVNRLQKFNIDDYTQTLNELKKQINYMQKESQNIQRQLKSRVNNLQKLRIVPQFETQLLEPYQNDIKKRLGTIDLQEARKRVFSKLGQFDYFDIANQVRDIGIDIQQQIDQFEFVCKQYQIHVPILKFDKNQIKALQLKLPSILEQYKQSHGIVFKQNQNLDRNKFQAAKQKQMLGSSKGQQILQKKHNNQNRIQSIPSKPKDLSNQIQYKKTAKDQFKTIMQKKPVPYDNQKKQLEQNKVIGKGSPKKPQDEQEFDAYLENIKNQELEILYRQKRDQLRRMKQDLYDQSTEPIEPYTRISYPKREEEYIQIQYKPASQNNTKIKINPNNTNQRINESSYKEEDSIGSRIFDPNEGAIKEIGKQVLKQKLKGLINKQKKPQVAFGQQSNEPARILPHQPRHQSGQQMGVNSINSFAEGFLTVINNTFAQMNKGISSSLQKRRPQQMVLNKNDQPRQRVRIPFPQLQQIPKPPQFNLKFQVPQRHPLPMFATFSNNFPQRPQAPVIRNDYSQYDQVQIQPYSQIIDDNSIIKSSISNVPSDNSFL